MITPLMKNKRKYDQNVLKVAISGMGIICSAGKTVPEVLASIEAGRRLAGPVSLFRTDISSPVFQVSNFIPRKGTENETRTTSLAFCAVAEALNDAGLSSDDLSGLRIGVCIGTTVDCQFTYTDFYRTYRKTGKASMAEIARYFSGNVSKRIKDILGISGPALTIVNACSSGADAIGAGLSWIRGGVCDIVIAGGADELDPVPMSGFSSLGVLSESLCAPFDRERDGLNLGEGAGILVLESGTCAAARERPPRLYLSGYGSANDAYHLTAPHPDGLGLEKAVTEALYDTGISSDDISFVNSHGTGTVDNDRTEAVVLARIFGKKLTFLSTKGYTGHTLGAAGGMDAVLTSMALLEGKIPASAGFKNNDPKIPVDPVRSETAIHGSFALSTSLAFGGNNAAIIIERPELLYG